MSGEKSIQLVTTPADPPFPSTQAFKIDGKLSDDGTFEAKVEDTTRGDGEVLIRAAFRQVPQPQWKDLVQQISYGLGYCGHRERRQCEHARSDRRTVSLFLFLQPQGLSRLEERSSIYRSWTAVLYAAGQR